MEADLTALTIKTLFGNGKQKSSWAFFKQSDQFEHSEFQLGSMVGASEESDKLFTKLVEMVTL